MKTIYYISGLGADERVFTYLNLKEVEQKYIRWITPYKNERLTEYCKRLILQIDPSDEIILVGVSFGGIVAQEISRICKVEKLIIISSIKSLNELDWQLDLVRRLGLHKLVPSRFLKWSNNLTGNYYFGVQSKAESALLKQIINDTDRKFMKWAIGEIMNWKGPDRSSVTLHIHGDNDRVFPVRRIKNFIRIANGGHFMIVNRAEKLSTLIQNEIQ